MRGFATVFLICSGEALLNVLIRGIEFFGDRDEGIDFFDVPSLS
jgi:hypothetical protein